MAEEVKKIITVEVGKSITSVRDFKKHIEDLRGALLGLNEESEEYKTIAEQIATDQAKLNDVMKIGKTNTDDAAGSYNALNNQLKALRQQYKALSETERNGTTGQAILQNITKLDTELKDIDESMGQYYRNVGNYKGAFEEAFKAMAQNIGNINPQLGSLMKTATQLIPLIKKASTAATTGLNGVRAALASTGIGLLVVALGEIVAHWEDIYKWIQKVMGKQVEYTKSVHDTSNEMRTLVSLAEQLSSLDATLQAKGYSTIDILRENEHVLNGVKWDYDHVNEKLDIATQKLKDMNELIDSAPMGLEWASKDIQNAWEDTFDYITGTIGGDPVLSRIFERQGKDLPELRFFATPDPRQYNGTSNVKTLERFFNTIKDVVNEGSADVQENIKTNNKKINDELESLQTGAIKIATDALRSLRSEEENLKADFDSDIAQMKEYIKNQEDLALAIEARTNQYNRDLRELRKRIWESSDAYKDLEQAKQSAKSLYDSLKDYGKSELQLLDEQYIDQLVLLDKFGYDTTNLTKKWQEEREKLVLEQYQKEQDELKEQEEKKLQIKRDAFQKSLDLQSNTEYLDTSAAETMWTINTKTHETDENLEYQKQDRLYQIAEQGYKDRIELYKQYLETLNETSDEHLNISRELHEEEMGLAKLQYDYQVELEDRLLEKKRKNLQIMQGMFQAYGELGSTVAGLIADASEEGTARWKAARITETVINTISGAAGAFMQGMSSYPQPWGAIIGAAGAAVATATGAAQIAKIKSTQIGTSSVSGISANSSGVGVEPLLNPDYDLQRLTNLSLQSDAYLPGNTQVYVLESDIQEVGNRVQVRENNATF